MNERDEGFPAELKRWIDALSWRTILGEADEDTLMSAKAREWQAWYGKSENQQAADSLGRTLDDRDLYSVRKHSAAEIEEDDYDPSVSIMEWQKSQRPMVMRVARTGFVWRRKLSISAVAVGIALVAIVSALDWGSLTEAPHSVYATTVGKIERVALNDGSGITLGGNTSLAVRFTAGRRSIRLIQGQALFKVAHDRSRPFVVTAGDGTVTAVGTVFQVTRDMDRIVVTVTEGTVEVSGRRGGIPLFAHIPARLFAPTLTPIRVTRGERLSYTDHGMAGPVTAADTRAAVAWTDGRLVFDNEPLRYVAESIERYSPRRISVAPSAGKLRFTGVVYPAAEADEWLDALKGIFAVQVDETDAGACVHMRSARAGSDTDSCASRR